MLTSVFFKAAARRPQLIHQLFAELSFEAQNGKHRAKELLYHVLWPRRLPMALGYAL